MKVNTDEVLQLASCIETTNNSITTSFEKVSAAMKSLNSSWGGAAGEKVLTRFNEMNAKCIETQKLVIADYANFLRLRVSAGYEQVETANTSLSEAFK